MLLSFLLIKYLLVLAILFVVCLSEVGPYPHIFPIHNLIVFKSLSLAQLQSSHSFCNATERSLRSLG